MLANNILLFSIGVMLMMVTAVNCRRVKATLSAFKQWCLSTDPMNRIALALVLCVPLINWSGYL